MNPVDISLYGILDPELANGRPLHELAGAAVSGGVTCLQYRRKGGSTEDHVREIKAVLAAIANSGVPLLVNDYVEAARLSGAQGAHLGQHDMAPDKARKLLGPSAIIGLTVHTLAEAETATVAAIDYACVGGVFPTASIENEIPIGIDGWRRRASVLRRRAPGLPVGAIAGIGKANAAEVIRAGADGIAVISALFMARDVAAAARELSAIVKRTRGCRSRIPVAVTIAGSDSGGGAGIQADIKAMSANGVYAASVLTALTAQNTLGVSAIHDVPEEFVISQIDAVFSDLTVDAVKVGMLSRGETVRAVAKGLRRYNARNIVLDPVMVAASGDPLIRDDAVAALVAEMFPLAALVTPNLYEAARLTGQEPAVSRAGMVAQARAIAAMTAGSVLLKGGHLEGGESADLLVSPSSERWYLASRITTKNTHGTGCSLSSAIAAQLALGEPLQRAVEKAKRWLTGAIAAADKLSVGRGHGPVHHFHDLWEKLT